MAFTSVSIQRTNLNTSRHVQGMGMTAQQQVGFGSFQLLPE